MMERSKELNDVAKAFPSAFRHVITQKKTSHNSFIGEVRANLKSIKDVLLWIKTFGKNTNTKWVSSVSKFGKSKKTKFIAEMDYVCYFCKRRKDKISAKKNCLAFVNFKILAEYESSSSEDAYLKQGLLGIIKINFSHNHEINSTRVLRSKNKVLLPFHDSEEGIGEIIDETTDRGVETSKKPSEKSGGAHSCAYCNVSSKQKPKRMFFKFPKDKERCKKWLEACQDSVLRKKSSSGLESLRVCSAHFVESDFAGPSKRRLKPDACPLFIEKSSKQEKVPPRNACKIGSPVEILSGHQIRNNRLKQLQYEGFASYESSSEESSDFEDEVPMDVAFGFERDNAEYEKTLKFGRFTHEGALSVEIRPVSPREFHQE